MTVTPINLTPTYGDATPTVTVLSYAGWKTGESQTVLTAAPTCSTTYLPTSPVASAETTQCAAAAAANYRFAYPLGTVVIARLAVRSTDFNGR